MATYFAANPGTYPTANVADGLVIWRETIRAVFVPALAEQSQLTWEQIMGAVDFALVFSFGVSTTGMTVAEKLNAYWRRNAGLAYP
jgi:hypothetical protein